MELIREALAPVLRDVQATTDVQLTVRDGAEPETHGPWAWVDTSAGSTIGFPLDPADTEPERILAAAEQVQELLIEELWARASNWPMCPSHRSSHPMQAKLVSDQAWWCCPTDSSLVARIGTLRL